MSDILNNAIRNEADAGRHPHGVRRITTSTRVDRILRSFIDAGMPPPDVVDLRAMISSPVEQWGHTQLVHIIKDCAEQLGVTGDDIEHLWYKNIEQYRQGAGRRS